MKDAFKSILKNELESFIEYIKVSIVDWKAYRRTLLDLDSNLHAEGVMQKKLEAAQLSRWFDGLNVHISTKKNKLSHIRKFSGYLTALSIMVSLPELPRNTAVFKPYVFSEDEMTLIFEKADDLVLSMPNSRIAAEFPVLLRILYGCGLRLGEAEALAWDDINLTEGIITVKNAKNKKQRIIPMCGELTRILGLYKKSACFDSQSQRLLFVKNNGQRRHATAYWDVFNKILCETGIKNPQNTKHGSRGPCIHSLRHTFTLHSLLKAEAEGREFMETVPFLSTYLGHKGLMETDKYLKARYELYTAAHAVIADYSRDVFPQEV
jgi:integrase